MEQIPLFGFQDFQEEKVVNLYDSLSMSPASKPLALGQLRDDPEDEPQKEKEEKPAKATKGERKRRHSLDEQKNVNRGHWMQEENKRYHWFLQIHYKHFVNRHMRRMDKIFKTMETFVGTRQAQQCRSHHQKMEKKYHDFISIVSNLRHQHYHCDDIQPITQDIEGNGIELTQKLATIAQLVEESELPINNIEVKERRKSSCKMIQASELQKLHITDPIPEEEYKEPQEIPQIPFNGMNMFDDSNLNIGELMMYHQKDENSGIFPFHKHFDE